ncbi:MAG TPA: hypothetical protein DCS93_20420 [Microscillaceae bacterium]|nr:hypothetical protein [Microscillaceae bacterium]
MDSCEEIILTFCNMTSRLKISLGLLLGFVLLGIGQVAQAQKKDSTLVGKNTEHVEKERHEFHEQIESRVLFGGGKNRPNELGQQHLRFIVEGLKQDIENYERLYPQDKIILKLEIKGYSDGKPFYTTQSDEERVAYNKYLSKKRAYYISNEIQKGLYESVHGVEQNIEAKGEELPPYYPEDLKEDPQRRMCIVTVLAYSMPRDSFNLKKNQQFVAIDHSKAFVPDQIESKQEFLAVNMPVSTDSPKKYRPGSKLTASNPTTNPKEAKTNKTPESKSKDSSDEVVVYNATKDKPKVNTGNITPLNNGKVVFAKANAAVNFHTGWHTPKPQDYRYLQQLIKEIKEKVAAYRQDNGDKPMVIQLDVAGYADKQGYYYKQPEAQRKRQNMLLSQWRAKNVGTYLQKFLKSQHIKVELKTEGRGEELPPGVTDGPINDPSRRTCLASIRVVEGQVVNSR